MTRAQMNKGPPGVQLPLGVTLQAGRRFDNFVLGSNAQAAAGVEALLDSANPGRVYLQGPTGTGKSHLLHASCARVAAQGAQSAYVPLRERAGWSEELLSGLASMSLLCIDDLDAVAGDRCWERALFRLFNEAEAGGARLLFASRAPPASIELPDLASRLETALRLRLSAPDDALREQVLRSRAHELGFSLSDDVLHFILSRESRDLHALTGLLEALDRFALASKRRVSVALVRQFLTQRTKDSDDRQASQRA